MVVVFFTKLSQKVKDSLGVHERKYSKDVRLYSCKFSKRIVGKRSNIQNFE